MENTNKVIENTKPVNDVLSWSVFIGSMFIGMAVGIMYGHEGAGMLVGLGVGFIGSAIVENFAKK